MSITKRTYQLTVDEAMLIGYILSEASRTLEYDREAGDYKSNDGFVVSLDKPDNRRLKALIKKF